MHLEFRVKPINDKKDTYWTSPILNHETVTGSKFFAEYIYNAFALWGSICALVISNFIYYNIPMEEKDGKTFSY